MHWDRRRVVCTLTAVPVELIITWHDPVLADSHPKGRWFKAKVGTSIPLMEVTP